MSSHWFDCCGHDCGTRIPQDEYAVYIVLHNRGEIFCSKECVVGNHFECLYTDSHELRLLADLAE